MMADVRALGQLSAIYPFGGGDGAGVFGAEAFGKGSTWEEPPLNSGNRREAVVESVNGEGASVYGRARLTVPTFGPPAAGC